MSQKTKSRVPTSRARKPHVETPVVIEVHGSLNYKPRPLSRYGYDKDEFAIVKEEYEHRPQTICVVAYYAQWKHLLQALMIDWLRSGGTRDDCSEYHIEVLIPLMRQLDVFSKHGHANRLYQRGEYLFRQESDWERAHYPIETRSIGLNFTPEQWRCIGYSLLTIHRQGDYIYPEVVTDLLKWYAQTITPLHQSEQQHTMIDEHGQATHQRYYLTLTLNIGFTRSEVIALYTLPFKRWRKRTRSHGRAGRNHTTRRTLFPPQRQAHPAA